MTLACETLHLYGRGVEVGRCPCCDAAWREDSGDWECLGIGRLVSVADLGTHGPAVAAPSATAPEALM
ncbi:MAG: hypothetical protein M0Z40_03690 [Actinomycetota bacterium]|nr:hypothetical protein [Actinomycetota bacterium]